MSKHVLKPSSDKVFTVNDEIRIALIGKTGTGKSASGNTIVGGEAFISHASLTFVTKKCQIARKVRGDKQIILVDTPGLFDTTFSIDHTKKEIAKCVTISSPGVHCFLVIIDASARYTEEETKTVDHILQMFGENSHQYLIVLFTRIDELGPDDTDEENFQTYLNKAPQDLKEFLNTCDNRCIWINNSAAPETKEVQVVKLFDMIEKLIRRNGGNCYTSELYEQTERRIKDAIDQAREKEEIQAREEREKLIRKIEKEQETISKEKLKEEMRKMQEQQEEDKKRQEEAHRNQIRNQVEKDDFSIIGKIIDFAADFLVGKFTNWFL